MSRSSSDQRARRYRERLIPERAREDQGCEKDEMVAERWGGRGVPRGMAQTEGPARDRGGAGPQVSWKREMPRLAPWKCGKRVPASYPPIKACPGCGSAKTTQELDIFPVPQARGVRIDVHGLRIPEVNLVVCCAPIVNRGADEQ